MNNTTNGADDEGEIWTHAERTTLTVFYVLVSASGITANFLIILLIFQGRVRRSPFNLLLTNLSVADMMASVSLFPYIFMQLKGIDAGQATRDLICSFTIGLTPFFVCTSVTVISMTMISVHRYISIRYPLRWAWHIGVRGVKGTVVVTWMLSIVVLLPNFYSFHHDNEHGVCYRSWPEGFNGSIYTIFTFVLGLLVPLVTFAFCFTATLKILRTQVADSNASSSHISRSRRKAVRLMGALIGTFLLCWGPFFIFWLISRSTKAFTSDRAGNYDRMRIIRIVMLFAATNTLLDPILYGLICDDFRRGLSLMFRSKIQQSLIQSRKTQSETYWVSRQRALTNISLPSPSVDCWQALKEEAAEKRQESQQSLS